MPRRRDAWKAVGIGSVVVALVSGGAVVWLLKEAPVTGCVGDKTGNHDAHKIRAIKAVVQPWRGEHHVYGIFMEPNENSHSRKYALFVTVRGVNQYVSRGERSGKRKTDVAAAAEPGYYVFRSYVSTRIALWFLVHGWFADLRNPCNWLLVFEEQPDQPISRPQGGALPSR